MGDMSDNEIDRRKEKREQFVYDLMGFHAAVGTPLMRLPMINGHEVDLLGLYTAVTGLGGWERVSDNNQWPDVGAELELPAGCVNSSVALKQIYLRFLDKYEKTHFVHKVRGEVEDEVEFNIRRMNKQSARTLYTIPTTYNDDQHNLNDEQRTLLGLNSRVSPDKFDKLQLSLISPLPNEQDFAINICTLLSLQGQENPINLKNAPRLLVNLLGHAGVFSDSYLKEFFCELYEKERGHEMRHFWKDSIRHDSLVWLTNEANFPGKEEEDCLMVDVPERSYLTENLTNCDFFIERVCQVQKILLNLTQHIDNVTFLANDIAAMRLVLLCCDCRHKKISELGWDLLVSIGSKIDLSTLGLKEIMLLVMEGITSEDISEVLASLRALSELAKVETNKKPLLDCLDREMFSKLCTYLTLQDVVIILCTLEALYALSHLDKLFCDSIFHTTGSLSILVLLLKFRVPLSATFGTWKNIRVSETIVSEDGTRQLAEKDLGALSVRPPEHCIPFYSNGIPADAYKRVENVSNCCATGDCRRSQKDEMSNTDVITLTTSPRKNSLLCNALRNSAPNGVKPVAVSTVGPAVTLKAHLEEPVTKIVKISNPGNQSLINTVKNISHNNSNLLVNVAYVTKKVTLNGKEFMVATPVSPPRPNSNSSEDTQNEVVTNNHIVSEISLVDTKPNCESVTNSCEVIKDSILNKDIVEGVSSDSKLQPTINGVQGDVKMNGLPEPDDYLCEWRGCLRKFKTQSGVFVHICSAHCPQTMLEGKCLWGNCTSGKMIYRILVKHIHKEHCHPDMLLPIRARTALRPRPSIADHRTPPPPPVPPPLSSPLGAFASEQHPHPPSSLHTNHPIVGSGTPMMPPPASHHFPSQPPHQTPFSGSVGPQGPRFYGPPPLASTIAGDRISESVRLTAALVLRNIACSCPPARRRLLVYEQQIVESAAFESESSRAAAECLSYLRV